MSATMADVAKLAGVSVKTVSNVVNEYPYVRQTTRDRVLAAVAELGYEVNLSARSLRSGRTGMIGLAVPELRLAYFGELADDVLRVAREHGVTVLIESTGYSRAEELEVLRGFRRRMTDGLLFSPVVLDAEDLAAAAPTYPLVLLGEQIFSPAYDHVTMRNEEAVRAAVRFLVERGRRRVAVIGARRDVAVGVGTAGLRYAGYLQALAEHGIAFDAARVGWTTASWHAADGAAAMAAVLDSGAQVDAVVALNDSLAIGAMAELRVRGLAVPGDVAVIGFDDTDEAQFTDPPLTSVDAGRREIARVAFELLHARVRAPQDDRAPTLHLAGLSVVERGSTPRL